MLRVTIRGLLAHKLRMGLSALAGVLGVAFVAGSLVFTDTLDKADPADCPRRHRPTGAIRRREGHRGRHRGGAPASNSRSAAASASRPAAV
jgi:hypothetical protein